MPRLLQRRQLAGPVQLLVPVWTSERSIHLQPPPLPSPRGWQGQGVPLPGPLSLGLPEPGVYLISVIDRLTHRPGTGLEPRDRGAVSSLAPVPDFGFLPGSLGGEVTGQALS